MSAWNSLPDSSRTSVWGTSRSSQSLGSALSQRQPSPASTRAAQTRESGAAERSSGTKSAASRASKCSSPARSSFSTSASTA